MFWNKSYWLEFLDQILRVPGDNILQEKFFIILASLEMSTLTLNCTIIHLSVCMPVRWLEGYSHKMVRYNWSARYMGRILDILEMFV